MLKHTSLKMMNENKLNALKLEIEILAIKIKEITRKKLEINQVKTRLIT